MKKEKRTIRKRKKEKVSIQERVTGILMWIFEICVTILIAFVLVYFLGQVRTNIGPSMELTLNDEDQVLIDTLSYRIGSPKRNDVIAFKPNGSETSHTNIKRVIGIPGDTIQIKNGLIYINDVVYRETDDYEVMTNPGLAIDPIYLDVKEYFVLGDNRNNSEDSRYADIGIVNSDYIEGRVWLKVYPRSEIGFVK